MAGPSMKITPLGTGTLSITGGRITGNTASGDGGGIYNADGAHIELPQTTIKNNQPDNCAPQGCPD